MLANNLANSQAPLIKVNNRILKKLILLMEKTILRFRGWSQSLRLFNLQLQRQRYSKLGEKNSKKRYAISCVVNFYNAGIVTRERRIGSWLLY
jgi:hypothetical protein